MNYKQYEMAGVMTTSLSKLKKYLKIIYKHGGIKRK